MPEEDDNDEQQSKDIHVKQSTTISVTGDSVSSPDPLINATIILPHGDCSELARVKAQK